MAKFNFPMHSRSVKYPETGTNIQMGGGHLYSAPSAGKDQRIFELKFQAMQYFFDSNGLISAGIMPQINLWALELFYQEHKRHKNFIYPDEIYGDIVVRFYKPFSLPHGEIGGQGVYKGITVELIEIPNPDTVDALTSIQFVPFSN